MMREASYKDIYISLAIVLLLPFSLIAGVTPDVEWNKEKNLKIMYSSLTGIEINAELERLTFEDIQIGGNEGSLISLPGEDIITSPGYPILPFISRLIAIPPDIGVKLEWEGSEPRLVDNKKSIVVFKDSLTTSLQIPSDTFWPPEIVQMGSPVIMRGIRIVNLRVNPVQVKLSTGEIRIWDNIKINLHYDRDSIINPIREPNKRRPSANVLKIAQSLVMNPMDINRDEVDGFGSYVYIIPNFNGVREVIEPLVRWRRRQGYPVSVIQVPANASNVDVKRVIQDAYDNWEIPPEFITLVGEADLVNADFRIPYWDVGYNYWWETDYPYVLLDGQDLLPDAAIGRISCCNLNQLDMIVNRIVNYEANPYMDETDWYLRGAVMSNDARSGYSTYFLQHWARRLMLEAGYTAVDTFFFMHDNPVIGREFILNNVNRGIAIFFYRGWASFNNDWAVGNARLLRNDRKMPFWLVPTCNSGDYADHNLAPYSYTEDFLWAPNGGCIGAVGSSGATHTTYNNVFSGGVINSFYRDGIWNTGWAINRGKIEMYRHFGLFNDVADPQVRNLLIWESHSYQFNLLGDPGSEIWTAIPQRMRVIHPQRYTIGENRFDVSVRDENDAPLQNVTVTLVKNNTLLRVGMTDSQGFMRFFFTPNELDTGYLQLTAWQHNRIPYLVDVAVNRSEYNFTASSFIIDDDNAGRSRGNGDRRINPGETIEFRTYISNIGDSVLNGQIDAILTLVEGDVRIITGQVRLDSAPQPNDSSLATFIIEVARTNWNNRELVFNLQIISEQNQWSSAIRTEIASFDLQYARHSFTPAEFLPGDTVWIDITLRNIGLLNSPIMRGTLISQNAMVVVYQNMAQFAPISVEGQDSLATARFRLFAHHLTIPGSDIEMSLRLDSDNGQFDTVSFNFTIGRPMPNAPFGPDKYGYICFDDTDQLWDEAPRYEWVEIDTNLGGSGINTGIRDLGNEQDFSVLVNLPFGFRYYGRNFNQLTICSNGWLAFGGEVRSADFTNRRIPSAYGPRAQVCAFWDNLVNYVDADSRIPIGGIFTYYDEERHRFIVEWSRMRRYVGRLGGYTLRPLGENTFVVILYDPQFYPTYTGDGEIVIQYHTVNNDEAVDPTEYDTPFATVGIVNLDGSDGLEYTYWNRYAPGAAPLQDGRAIKFTTKLIGVVGFVRGTVVDAATNRPIMGAQIRGSRGSFAVTDQTGNYFMNNVLVGEDYSFTASAPGYCDSTRSGYNITFGDTLEVSFALLHPEFILSEPSIRVELQPNYLTEKVIVISNEGNGRLDYRSFIDYVGEPGNWRRLLDFNVTSVTEDWRINGADFFDGKIWVTGSNNNDNPNQFYRFDIQGRFIDAIPQPGASIYGIRGTTVIDTLLYGGEGSWIIGINKMGIVRDSISSPMQVTRALTYDPMEDCFWAANSINEPLVKFDRDGNVIASYQLPLDIYGLSFYPNDPEDYFIYIFSRNRINPQEQVPTAMVSKLNPQTGDLRFVTVVEGNYTDRAGGMEFSNKFDPHKWVMVAVINNVEGHRVSVFDIGPNTSWVSYTPRVASVLPGANQILTVRFDATDLRVGLYAVAVRFLHNAAGLQTLLPITLCVDSSAAIYGEDLTVDEFGIETNFPNPFNSKTKVIFSLESDEWAKLAMYDISGREVLVIYEGQIKGGRNTVDIDANGLSNGIYILQLKTINKVKSRKIVIIK